MINNNSNNDNYNPMPMNSKSFLNTDFYSTSLLKQKKENVNNSFLKRHFYKIPENNQDNLAKLLFPNTSACRDSGYLCKVEENSSRNLNRIYYDSDKYTSQNLNIKRNMKDKLNSILNTDEEKIEKN